MYHLKVHRNQGIKRRQSKDKDATVPTTEYQSIETQQLSTSWLNQRHGMIKWILHASRSGIIKWYCILVLTKEYHKVMHTVAYSVSKK